MGLLYGCTPILRVRMRQLRAWMAGLSGCLGQLHGCTVVPSVWMGTLRVCRARLHGWSSLLCVGTDGFLGWLAGLSGCTALLHLRGSTRSRSARPRRLSLAQSGEASEPVGVESRPSNRASRLYGEEMR